MNLKKKIAAGLISKKWRHVFLKIELDHEDDMFSILTKKKIAAGLISKKWRHVFLKIELDHEDDMFSILTYHHICGYKSCLSSRFSLYFLGIFLINSFYTLIIFQKILYEELIFYYSSCENENIYIQFKCTVFYLLHQFF